MSIKNQEINEILERLRKDMIEFIEPGETEYNEIHVKQCIEIITDYLSKIEKAQSKDDGMEIVKNTVMSLNELNEKCEYELIETGQREDIAEIIIIGASLRGFNERDEDITEEWRDW